MHDVMCLPIYFAIGRDLNLHMSKFLGICSTAKMPADRYVHIYLKMKMIIVYHLYTSCPFSSDIIIYCKATCCDHNDAREEAQFMKIQHIMIA